MTQRWLKNVAKGVTIFTAALLALLLIAPYLIAIRSLEGFQPAQQLANADSRFVSSPFAGTDGLKLHYLEQRAGVDDDSR